MGQEKENEIPFRSHQLAKRISSVRKKYSGLGLQLPGKVLALASRGSGFDLQYWRSNGEEEKEEEERKEKLKEKQQQPLPHAPWMYMDHAAQLL